MSGLAYLADWPAVCLVFTRIFVAIWIASRSSLFAGMKMRWRTLLAWAFALTLMPFVPDWHSTYVSGSELVGVAVSEVMTGALFGFGIQLWLLAADVCSQLFGQLSGLGMMVFSRSPDQSPLANCFRILWAATFFLAGGHRVAVAALLDSFAHVHLGSFVYNAQTFGDFVSVLTTSLMFGLQAGIPIIATLLLTALIMMLLARVIPQIHVLATSTGLGAAALVAGLWVGIGPMLRMLEIQVPEFVSALSQALFTM